MAIEYAINHGILEAYFRNNRAEVLGMLLYDYDEKKYRRTIREEGYEDGVEYGIKQGIEQGIEQGIKQGRADERKDLLIDLVNSGDITIETAAEKMEITKEEFEKKYAEKLN